MQKPETEQTPKEITEVALYGDLKTFIGPSGHSYTIQEQNGEHDSLLSNISSTMSGDNYDMFVASIVIKTDLTTSGKIMGHDVQNIPSLDFAMIILQSRLHSLGAEIKFTYEWETGKPSRYIEDLKLYLPDFSLSAEDLELWIKANPLSCPKYPNGNNPLVEFTTTKSNKFKFSIATRGIEKLMLGMDEGDLDINTKLKIRGLKQELEGKWITVTNFQYIKAAEMRQIRGYLDKFDPTFNAVSEITNPVNKMKHTISLLELQDFFFPAEI